MASLMEELIDVLDKECQQYDALLKVALEKTSVIISNDLERLQSITNQEQGILDILVNLDKKRDACMNDIAAVLNKKANRLTITNIVELMAGQPEYQKPLAKLHDKLLDLALQLRRITTHNQDLLKDAIEMTEFDINLIQSMNQAPETANYAKGSYSGDTLGAAVSKFDTKQ